ncbi:MAG: sulfatase-like hydrolase/transferase, partial [Eubacteriales bacterium]|nr:sulfatase-like hydrolase/transferase [Eubacteriales bacterium]
MHNGTDLRRNIVLILCDQLRPDFLHAYGADFIPTPNIDALAAHGVTFDNSITASTVCAPARAAIMTGKFVSGHDALTNG